MKKNFLHHSNSVHGVALCIMIFAASMLSAQNTQEAKRDTTKNAQIEEVTIIGAFEPIVKDAYKIRSKPVIENKTVKLPVENYAITSSPVMVYPIFTKLTETTLPKKRIITYDRNFIKVGMGNYGTPLAEFYASSTSSKKRHFALHMKHLSSQGGIEGYPDNAFSNNQLSLGAKQMRRYVTFSEKVWVERNVVHYYGFPKDIVFTDENGIIIDKLYEQDDLNGDASKQRYLEVGGVLAIESNFRKNRSPINFKLDVGYVFFGDRFGTAEHEFSFVGDIFAQPDWFDFADQQQFGVALALSDWINQYDVTPNDTTTYMLDPSVNTLLFQGKPYYRVEWDEYSVEVGAKVAVANDSSSTVKVYPDVKLGLELVPEKMSLFVHFGGGLERNSFRSLATENAFVSSFIPLGFTDCKLSVQGGVKGKITERLAVTADVGYSIYEDYNFFVTHTGGALPFFTSAEHRWNSFTVLEDNVKRLDIGLDAHYIHQDLFEIKMGGRYFSYALDQLSKPYHKPAFNAYLTGIVHPIERLTASLKVIALGPQYALSSELINGVVAPKDIKLDGTIDICVGANYKVLEKLNAFVQLNNLLGDHYEKWYRTPTQGFNFMLGATYTF